MEFYFIGFLLLVCGGFIGYNIHKAYTNYIIKSILKSIKFDVPAESISVIMRKEGNKIYVYDADTKMFLTHGISKDEIIDNLKKMYPNQSFKASAENMEDVGL